MLPFKTALTKNDPLHQQLVPHLSSCDAVLNGFVPIIPAGIADVSVDPKERPPPAVGRLKGPAEAAGLLNPKLKPVVAAAVVAGAPTTETNDHCIALSESGSD